MEREGDRPTIKVAPTESPPILSDAALETEQANYRISPGLRKIVADPETRDFILKELSHYPDLESRFGAQLFHSAVLQADRKGARRRSSRNKIGRMAAAK